ncbi:hypothetical protein GCM10027341_54690 [Spirosoma knui]
MRRQQEELEAANRKLQQERDAALHSIRSKRLLETGFTESSGNYFHPSANVYHNYLVTISDEKFDALIDYAIAYNNRVEEQRLQAEAEEAQRIKDEAESKVRRL